MAQVREIEFRAKAVYDNKWVYGFPIHYANPRYEKWTIREPSGLEHEVDESTLGQYSGFTDDVGKKIYEGDIIEYSYEDSDSDTGWHGRIKHTCDVAFKYGGFRIDDYPCDLDSCFDLSEYAIRVVGNTYDNPDLIKK